MGCGACKSLHLYPSVLLTPSQPSHRSCYVLIIHTHFWRISSNDFQQLFNLKPICHICSTITTNFILNIQTLVGTWWSFIKCHRGPLVSGRVQSTVSTCCSLLYNISKPKCPIVSKDWLFEPSMPIHGGWRALPSLMTIDRHNDFMACKFLICFRN